MNIVLFLHIFIEVAPLCALFATLAYFTELAWHQRRCREIERARVVDDPRPADLYSPVSPFEERALPWKEGRWNA
jgi:hypothetical protein